MKARMRIALTEGREEAIETLVFLGTVVKQITVGTVQQWTYSWL